MPEGRIMYMNAQRQGKSRKAKILGLSEEFKAGKKCT
jgi:hypothetical protein